MLLPIQMAPPEVPPEEVAQQLAFSALVNSLLPQQTRPAISKFVKKIGGLQEVSLPPALPRMATLALAEKGLIGKFTSLWPSPKTIQRSVERNWADKIQGKIAIRFCGKGYFTFHFETKNDKDMNFRKWAIFYGLQRSILKQVDARLVGIMILVWLYDTGVVVDGNSYRWQKSD